MSNVKTAFVCVILAVSSSQVMYSGIIGNIPFDDMRRVATQVVAGVVRDVTNTPQGSLWTIQVAKSYKGNVGASITAKTARALTVIEIESVRSKRGLFMLDTGGVLMQRTGSAAVTDLYVPYSTELSQSSNAEVALCADWMRGLFNPNALLARDLAVAAAGCGKDKAIVDGIRTELGGSPKSSDMLIAILTGMAYSDPSVLPTLEAWLGNNLTVSPLLIENIAWGMYAYASPDASGSSALRRLALGTRYPRIQYAAATTLVYIHSEETWSDLAALLNASDMDIRMLGLHGLQQAVDAGQRGEEVAPFERALRHLGQPIKRTVRARPPIPDSVRILAPQVQPDELKLLSFWREYAFQNR